MSGRVRAITLPSNNLTGTLPSDLNTLTNLSNIDLHNNTLAGLLPYLSGLYLLQTVSFGHNNFTSIPDSCFRVIPNLRTLNLSNNLNLLPWLFPTDLRDSSFMQTLDLEATNILATLPSDMFDWFPSLHTVFLSHNNITGKLPVSLGKSVVRYLRFNDQGTWNRFTGSIDVISSMKFLSQAWLHNNGFTGPTEVFSRTFGAISHKSDVYSYGMLIMEMIGGRKNYDTGGSCTSEMYFADWIYKDLELCNNLVNGLAYSKEERDLIRKIIMVSIRCIQTNRSDRPSMNKVIEMLQGPLESVAYPPKPFLYSPEMPSLQTS